MKALVYTAPNTVEIRQHDDPVRRQDDDVIVRVDAVGICGSDMHAYLGHDARRVPPMILGHEVAGTVIEGPGVGRRVILNPLITCGRCEFCQQGRTNLCSDRDMIGMNLPGGFAQALAIPERCLVTIPDGLEARFAAMTEPAATSLHAMHLASRALTRTIAESRILVIGGGSVGLFAALFARDQGAASVSLAETNQLRRETASNAGINDVIDPVAQSIADNEFDLVVDAVGGAVTRDAAVAAVKPGGVVMHIGLMDNKPGLDVRKITLAEITFIGTYTYSTLDLEATVNKLASGALGDLKWVETRNLDEGPIAFDDLLNGRSAAPKIVLVPDH